MLFNSFANRWLLPALAGSLFACGCQQAQTQPASVQTRHHHFHAAPAGIHQLPEAPPAPASDPQPAGEREATPMIPADAPPAEHLPMPPVEEPMPVHPYDQNTPVQPMEEAAPAAPMTSVPKPNGK